MKMLSISARVNRFAIALCLMGLLSSLSACEGPDAIEPTLAPTTQARRAATLILTTSTPTACTLVRASAPAAKLAIALPALPRVIIGQPVKPRRVTY